MSLDGKTCGGLIYNQILPILQGSFSGTFDLGLMRQICDAIGEGVVQHIQQSAIVNTTVTGTCSTGPITGTGTGKVS